MSDIKKIPKKCHECNEKTTTRREREWMCPRFHKVIEGRTIALCEHPFILTDEQLSEKIAEYKKEIDDLETRIRENKDDIRRCEGIIENQRRFISEVDNELDPYLREQRDRECEVKLLTEDMFSEGIRIKSIEFRQRGKRRKLAILFVASDGRVFGREITQSGPGHSIHNSIGVQKDWHLRRLLDHVDPVVSRLHEVFEGWLLCKQGN